MTFFYSASARQNAVLGMIMLSSLEGIAHDPTFFTVNFIREITKGTYELGRRMRDG